MTVDPNKTFVYEFANEISEKMNKQFDAVEKESAAGKLDSDQRIKEIGKIFDTYASFFANTPYTTFMYNRVIFSSRDYFCTLGPIFKEKLQKLIVENNFKEAGEVYRNIERFQSSNSYDSLAIVYNTFFKTIAQQLLKKGEDTAIKQGIVVGHNVAAEIALELAKQNKLDKALNILKQLKEKDYSNLPNLMNSQEAASKIYELLMEKKRVEEALPFLVLGYERNGSQHLIQGIAAKFWSKNMQEHTKPALKTVQLLLDAGLPKNIEIIQHSGLVDFKSRFLVMFYDQMPQIIRLLLYHGVVFPQEVVTVLGDEIEKQRKIVEDIKTKAIARVKEEQPALIKQLHSEASKMIAENISPNPAVVAGIVVDYAQTQLINSREVFRKCLELDSDFGFDPETLLKEVSG